ncbi:MAG: glyoxylate/hydroxypyruvate reductase A [Alphaproteobacteria bacterium]|jgi:glyoxylate/hydroxypyruvate reductase A
MALLIKAGREPVENWIEAFNAAIPDMECRPWPDVGNPDDIEVVVANELPEGVFSSFPNLKLVAGTRVGVEGLLKDTSLPAHIPILRNTDRERAATMTAWVLYNVIRHHRRFEDYKENQSLKKWEHLKYIPPEKTRIGIMGMGMLGTTVARALNGLMYQIAGWSRSRKVIPDVESFAGLEELESFLARTEILITILPKTPALQDLMNAERFAQLPKGAYVINCGRGDLTNEDALLAALDSGHLSGAALDVFKVEPLPQDSTIWEHPKITLTPHYSCNGRAVYGAEGIIEAILKLRNGETLTGLVDRSLGY